MSAIVLKEVADSAIATPSTGKAAVFVDAATGEPSYKDDAGVVASLKGATGPAGAGVPNGGATGQVLKKLSASDQDTGWASDGSAWGGITGTLSAQTDLQAALNAKIDDSQASAFGLTVLGAADAAAARTALALGTAATQASTAFATAAQGTKADGAVQSVVAGTNITVDNTDPDNPVISAAGGGGSGDVVGPASSVNLRVAVFSGTTGKLLADGGTLLSALAPLASPTFTGTPAAPTATAGTSTTQLATTAFALSIATQAVASSATVTPTFLNDIVTVTAQAVSLTLANPTGTAKNGWGIVIRIKDNGTARAISYGTQYRAAVGVTLPTTTVVGQTIYMCMIFNSTDTRWDVLSVASV